MKYFKHLSSARSDFRIQKLLAEYGSAGYGLYWILNEEVASAKKSAHDDPEVYLPWARLVHETGLRRHRLSTLTTYLGQSGLIVVTASDKTGITVQCPKLNKYTAEYQEKLSRSESKKSGHSPDKVPTVSPHKNRIEENRREKNRIAGQASPLAQDGQGEPAPISDQERTEGLNIFREARKKMGIGAFFPDEVPKPEDLEPAVMEMLTPRVDEGMEEYIQVLDFAWTAVIEELQVKGLESKTIDRIYKPWFDHKMNKISAEQFSDRLTAILPDRRKKLEVLGIAGMIEVKKPLYGATDKP